MRTTPPPSRPITATVESVEGEEGYVDLMRSVFTSYKSSTLMMFRGNVLMMFKNCVLNVFVSSIVTNP